MIEKSIISYKNYGQSVKLSNGIIEAVVTVDVGPRIVYFGFIGKENIMNNHKDEFEPLNNELMDKHFYKGAAWNNYGGHRLWVSPEVMPDTYYPDNTPVEYELTEYGVKVTPPPQEENGLALDYELIMSEDKPTMKIVHSLKNISKQKKDLSLWALSVCEKNGTLIIPTNTNDTGLLPNRQMAIWPYTDISDERLFFGNKYVTITQNPKQQAAMKLGFDLNKSTVYYVLGNSVFKKSYDQNHPNGRYPDGGVSMETYCNGLIIEIETLSEQKLMKSGETAYHTEYWEMIEKPCELNPKDNNSIEAFVNNLR